MAYVNRQYGCTVEVIQSDNEKALSKEFGEWCRELGIRFEPLPTYSPSLNGRSKRSGGVIITMAWVLRNQSRLPANLWSEIFLAVGYILDRTPRARLNWKAPLKDLYDRLGRPNPFIELAHLRVYGCRCYSLIHKEEMDHKLDPKAHLGYLVGYEASNIWRVWVPGKKLNPVIRSRSVRFDEQQFFNPNHQDFAVQLREQADEIFETVRTSHNVFDLDSESESERDSDSDIGDTIIVQSAPIDATAVQAEPTTEPMDTIVVQTAPHNPPDPNPTTIFTQFCSDPSSLPS